MEITEKVVKKYFSDDEWIMESFNKTFEDKTPDKESINEWFNRSITEALQEGKPGAALRLVEQGADYKQCFEEKHCYTPFLIAAAKGYKNFLSLALVGKGINMNQTDNSGHTALMLASRHGHLIVVQWLCSYPETSVNETSEHGATALMFAAAEGHLDIVAYLVEKCKVKLHIRDHYGRTALTHSVTYNRFDTFKYLISHKANYLLTDDDDETILMCAAEKGHLDIVKYLVEELDVPVSPINKMGQTALSLAVYNGRVEVVKYLIKETDIRVDRGLLMISNHSEIDNILTEKLKFADILQT